MGVKAKLVADSGEEFDRVLDAPLGCVINGRELVDKKKVTGEFLGLMRCPLCAKEAWCSKTRLRAGITCTCQAVEKNKKTNMDRYGCEFPSQRQDVQEQIKENCKQKFGVDSVNKLESKKKKTRATNRKKYGTDYASQSLEIKEKTAQTFKDKFGGNPMSCPDIVERSLKTRADNDKANLFRSKAELEIEAFLKSIGVESHHHSSGAYELDVFIPSLSIGIEYNGCYYHREVKEGEVQNKRRGNGKIKRYHINKTEHYAAKGIEVIHIWDVVWRTRKEQVKNFLQSRVGKISNRVGVRKCLVTTIDAKTARDFIEAHHIQGGKVVSTLAIGAYYQGELIAVASFCPHHRGNGTMTLNRICSKYDWTCSGFLSKATKMAYEAFKVPIYTWVDRALSGGKSYLAAGYVVDSVLDIDYFYYNDSTKKIIKKQSFRKIDERTEAQRASDEGLHKIYDCGKIRFVFKPLAEASKPS